MVKGGDYCEEVVDEFFEFAEGNGEVSSELMLK